MVITARMVLVALSVVIAVVGVIMMSDPPARPLAWVVLGCAVINIIVLNVHHERVAPAFRGSPESDDIGQVSQERLRQLVRGTSLHLRDMNYRYSIRMDPSDTSQRRCFSAEVNTVRLGFVPVVITDNTTDRQGYGYVAFVYDERRWRGPGLPCPDGQPEAVRHAAKCVSPLAKDEETRF